ncbi:MAG: multidrug transporter AcrB, partial [Rhodomicrobium sp.]|nr:multidrug transporter AcrB [Rhodomicrobium sp.]
SARAGSMRVWIDRQALSARNLTVTDIETALQRENIELPAGRIESKDLNYQVRIARNYQTADQFRNLVIAQGADGHLVRLGEVATVEVASRETNRIFRTNGALTTGFGIIKQSTANTVEVLDAVKSEVSRVNADLPEGMELITSGDESLYIRAAIEEIYWTIGITTVLVGFVIFGLGGLMRFRTETSSTRDTSRLIIVTLIGLICGLNLPHFAVLATLSQIMLTQALREGDASFVLPFDYSQLVFSALLGLIVYSEVPSIYTALGSSVIVMAALLSVAETRRPKLRPLQR